MVRRQCYSYCHRYIMFVAFQKKKENICEYLLYMFQIEDIIRACKLDRPTIEKLLLPKYPSELAVQAEGTTTTNGLGVSLKLSQAAQC